MNSEGVAQVETPAPIGKIAPQSHPTLSVWTGSRDTIPETPLKVLERDLSRLAVMIRRLTDVQYGLSPVEVFESSIGAHVRHCLDHVEAFLVALDTGLIDYDARERGTEIETNRRAALDKISDLRRRTEMAEGQWPDRTLRLIALLTKCGPTIEADTTVGRELVYVLAHTTHHNAIIAAMTKLMNIEAPPDFGVAASTAAYRQSVRCAR